jgi:hypothetical protein
MNAQTSTAALQRPATASRTAVGAEQSRAALSSWLLGENIQIPAGTQAGAVAGWIDREGRASYVYPEITGYYLQWLAWDAACHGASDDTRRRADAAQRWLLRWSFAAETPETRVYLEPAMDDWRNSALFCFDLAMVLRGLASATRLCLIEPDPKLVARISELLWRLVADDGLFDACSAPRAGSSVPDRWSTRRGAFLSKAAGGVLLAATQFPLLPPPLARAADATFAAALESMSREQHGETHPLLYGIEGALSLPEHPATTAALPHMVRQLSELFERSTQLGHMPESLSGGRMRLDIVAQAARAAALLLPQHVDSMAQVLVHYTDATTGILFSPDGQPPQYSVWTAMFAEQALFAAGRDPRDPLPAEFRLCLV